MNKANSSPPAMTFERLGHCYHPGQWVFRQYSGCLEKGKISAVLGSNGCGKTTLLKLLLGVILPTEGRVSAHGRIAFVPQLFQVNFDYTVLDLVLMGRASHVSLFSQPSAKDEQAALTALDRFGLADLADRPFHELSGGQRQMAIFARALVAEADILLLDEPTGALDLKNQAVVLDWISHLSHGDGLTILFTTHQPYHALAIADHALLMLNEGTRGFGSIDTMLTEGNLRALYGVEMKRVSFDYGNRKIETIAPVYLTPRDHSREMPSNSSNE